MPELPEISSRALEMDRELGGKTIADIHVFQPKCLNVPPQEFIQALRGATIRGVKNHGKWLFIETDQGWFLLSLGMGGEILLVTPSNLPEKRRLELDFIDGSALSINFWWFGYAHYVALEQLDSHAMTARLGPNAIDIDAVRLKELFKGQRGRLKAFLLDQTQIAGIGNAYIHDILFLAHLHPMRSIHSLTEEEIKALAQAIQDGLRPSLEKGGAFYEVNLHGQKGGFLFEKVLIGYRPGQPCPVCGSPIEKIKTGSTSSFICPHCQPLEQ